MGAVVRFNHVGKKFCRGEVHDSLRDLLSSSIRRLCGRHNGRVDNSFWALRDVCFEVEEGQALGIIGPNGAGKSTALKLLSGILRCDEGTIEVEGRLAALIEVGAGMHGDLTGLENIYLNGAVMGMTRQEINSKLDDIIAFSGLESFIHTPVKRFSTGMQARLGFSTAAHVSPDVLLVDEVLSVGDAAFRHRCEQRMTEMVRNGTTLIFVTHNLEQMRRVCDRALVLDSGRCAHLGATESAVEHYLDATMNVVGAIEYTDQPIDKNRVAEVIDLQYLGDGNEPLTCADPRKPVRVEVSFEVRRHVPRLGVEVNIRQMGGELLVSMASSRSGVEYEVRPGITKVVMDLPAFPVASGTYSAQVRLMDLDSCRFVDETPYKYRLQVDDNGLTTGMLSLVNDWSPVPQREIEQTPVAAGAA